jgi:predicted GNAT superfamily acetyltransferase
MKTKIIARNKTENVSISLPKDIKKMATDYAQERDITLSQTVKEALRSYILKKQFDDLRESFRPLAKKLKIKSDEDVERIFG